MSFDYDRLRELADEHTPGPWVRHPDQPRALCNLDTKFLVHHEMVKNRGMEPSAEDVANTELIALAPDMARELLRLRDEVEKLREMCLLERDAAFQETPMREGEVKAFNICAEQLTDLLDGDAKQ